MKSGEQLVWGKIARDQYAVALGDQAIGLVHGSEEVGFTAQRMDRQLVGVYDHLYQAVEALHQVATRRQ